MASKKILIISRSFYPRNSPRSFRTTELAKEFARQGHVVTVLTPKKPEHSTFEKKYNLTIQDLGHPKWKEVQLKGGRIDGLFRRGIRRFLQIALEYPNLEHFYLTKNSLQNMIKQNEIYDLLISIAVPHSTHWGVAAVWGKKNNLAKTWIADCGDPFMGEENDSFKPAFYFKYVEKWFCKRTDFITVPVNTAIPAYYPEFHDRIKVIPQGFNFDEIQVAPYEKHDIPHFAYAGGLISGRRDPKDFLEFLVNYPFPYQFDVYTNQINLVKPYARRSQGRIIIKEYLPRKELLFELSKLDFVVNFENAGNKQIPSKIIDYLIIKKPILSVNSFVFDKEPVEEFLSGNYINALQVENSKQYRIENVAKQFLKLANS